MKLFFREIGEGKPMIILHGLFGSSDNWLSVSKRLGEFRKLYIVDLRNHGQSPHDPVFDYDGMVKDLEDFIQTQGLDKPDLLGHSLGGKVAMKFAAAHPDLLDNLIVVDIAPRAYPVHHDTILEGLNAINVVSLESRKEADETLASYVPQVGVRQFLLKNLKRTDSGFDWKMNLDAITQSIAHVGEELEDDKRVNNPTLFIRGEQSNYIADEDFPRIMHHFPNARIETIRQASHWIHAEQPEALSDLVEHFLVDNE